MPLKTIVVAVIIAAIVLVSGLILLGLAGDFLVDWAWFSAVGYLSVFWTILSTKTVIFFAVFVCSGAFLWLNGLLASRFSGRGKHAHPLPFDWQSVRGHTLAELLKLMPRHVAWPQLVAGVAGILGILIATAQMSNWDVFLRFLYHVPYGQDDPVYGKDIGFYLFSLPAYVALKNWMLLILVVGACFAGGVYWVHGDVEFDRQPPSVSPPAIAHGSALLGLFFAVSGGGAGFRHFLRAGRTAPRGV